MDIIDVILFKVYRSFALPLCIHSVDGDEEEEWGGGMRSWNESERANARIHTQRQCSQVEWVTDDTYGAKNVSNIDVIMTFERKVMYRIRRHTLTYTSC